MRKLLSLLILCLVGLGCYQLGRQPNSPDVVGRIQAGIGQVDWQSVSAKAQGAFAAAREKVSSWSGKAQASGNSQVDENNSAADVSQANACNVDKNWQQHQQGQREEIPQCW